MVSKKYQYVLVQLSCPLVCDTVFKVDHAARQKEENIELQINCNWHGRHTKKQSALLSDYAAKWTLPFFHTNPCDFERAKTYKYVQIVPKNLRENEDE